MSFKLTYSTMFDPPEELHTRFEAALARLRAQLGATHALHIDGRDVGTAQHIELHNPADRDELLGRFAAGTAEDAGRALEAARRAGVAWRALPWAERLAALHRVADVIESRVFDIAAALVLEVGKNRLEAIAEAQEAADFFRLYADDFAQRKGFVQELPNDPVPGFSSRNRGVMKPYGVWVVIVPFNFPLALGAGPAAAALTTGNTVVLKGATATPWSGRLLADCIRDAHLPPGVFNYLSGGSGALGDALIDSPLTAGVTFTGSYPVGMRILGRLNAPGTRSAGVAWPRPCIAEMGGKNPCIVTAGADLERATAGIVRSAFGMGGQKCSALSRLYVESPVAEALIGKLQAAIAALRIGDPSARANWLGPVATVAGHENYQRYVAQLREDGARVLAGGAVLREGPLARGLYVAPTLAEAPPEHPLWNEELFLPILMLQRVGSREEAMERANDTPLGLTAGFYGRADEVAWFQDNIEAGVTYANRPQGATTGAWPGYQPFGGWKGSGNTGKAIASAHYLALYLREQSQTVVD